MSKLSKQIEEINLESHHRSLEINYMFSQLNSFDNKFLDENLLLKENLIDDDGNEMVNVLDKYFLARSVLVFSYATIERFVKSLSQHALTAILDNNYFSNNVKDLMCILKFQNKPVDIFSLIMHYKKSSSADHDFEFKQDKGYFSRRDRIDSNSIVHIVSVLDLNKKEPLLKIPKLTLDNLAKARMNLAHGDYLGELKRFNASRDSIKIEDINNHIDEVFHLNETTKDELVNFIEDFKNKIVGLLSEIDEFTQVTTTL
ncbi:Uncharacterised protein [[Clostridium] sordellii]|uniref:hypothetical protein n=1 Tax=Paraclostridium sordellii TaxID=1505 RepID=UPI0005DC8CD8|nr:hypothetical protein [Paeniclostridium sordellii]CEN31006.1 Uncharacterised protein [[Clostridium] sordellii] [Paeniclostridium sordellii]